MGPWYEETCPSAAWVRADWLKKLRNGKENDIIYDENSLCAILYKYIPDTMNNFGSWRGYTTFGLDSSIQNSIHKEIECRKVALEKIKFWLRGKVLHYLYKPGGLRMKTVSEQTLVGKIQM